MSTGRAMTKRSVSPRAAPSTGSRGALSCTAVAKELGVAPNTVRHWCREGWLRAHVEVTKGGHYRIPRRVFDTLLRGELGPPGFAAK